ncbi:MAG: tetratricopeptide repeat protein [Spirochaetales bacterium]|nr:tetratricopeptide repeat protein [Spirochaetales bacterium]
MRKDKYIYHLSGKKKKKWRIVMLFIFICLLCAAGYFFLPFNKIIRFFSGKENEINLNKLWNNKNYDEIIRICNEKLLQYPLHPLYLTYKGFSYFYKAKTDTQETEDLLTESILVLRKAKLSEKSHLEGEIDYVLGLAYFLKGKYYYDLTVKYMLASLENNYTGIDTYRCLGLAYGGLGDSRKELDFFLKALEQEETGYALLSVGEAYLKKSDYEKAEEYLLRALNKADEPEIIVQCRFKLGEIYMEKKDYFKAEEQYKEIIRVNEASANAHFYLGEVYYNLNDRVKARSEWREALRIDPSHYGAKLRYYR